MKHGSPRLVLLFLVLGAPAWAQQLELPHKGLETRVDFWKKIFTQYGEDDIVIHDRFYVNLIYDVADASSVNSKVAAAGQTLDEIRQNLNTPENLSPSAQRVYVSLQENNVPLTDASLADLRDDIHTQHGIKERFRDGIVRSGRYVGEFQRIMKSEGVIPELALLPLVESSYQNNAKSKAAAIGVWQFTRSTARTYMRVGGKGDDRLDPVKATHAAAKLLYDNYSALGSWPLAITAYNHGRAGMVRAKSEKGSDLPTIINEYRGPSFGYASMNFYTEFLAAVDVYHNYQTYFGALALDKPSGASKSEVVSTATSSTKTAARKPKPAAVATTYKVKSGDTLSLIAQRFQTTIQELMQKNGLHQSAIYAGQILLVK